MAISARPSGVRVQYPDTFRITEPTPPARARRRAARDPLLATDPGEQAAEHDALLTVLAGQGMQHVDTIPLAPTVAPTDRSGRRARGAPPVAARQSIDLDVSLAEDEAAVVLVEQDGLYSWRWPTAVELAAPAQATRSRRGRGIGPEPATATPGAAATRVAHFTIDVRASSTPAAARASRGVIQHFVYGPVRTFVLTYVAVHVVGKVITFLERHVDTRLVIMDDVDPLSWHPVDAKGWASVPKSRPARVLLFVHGTFSSTIGGFNALGVHPWGKEFLRTAIDHYDLVLGYDHKTLSLDPTENAVDLHARLKDLFGDTPPEIDVVCHSRGGLVSRALFEIVGPASSWRPKVDRVVFVAVPNAGTLLAEPDNWKSLVDLYTNLSMAATRALGLITGSPHFVAIIDGCIKGLSTLVTVLADATVTEQGSPGLAAMEPRGPYIAELNKTQSGQPTSGSTWFFVGTSDFKANGAGGPTSELPPRFVQLLLDGFVDQLMKEPNDLVVNVASVGSIDPAVGGFVDDRLDYPANRAVYHCNYFSQPEMVGHMASWLQVPVSAAGPIAPSGPLPPSPTLSVNRGRVVGPALPHRVSTNVVVVGSRARVGEVLQTLKARDPDWLVIRRPFEEGGYAYAYRPSELRQIVGGRQLRRTLDEVLVLHETTESYSTPVPLPAMAPAAEAPSIGRQVIVRDGNVAGVVAESAPPPSADQLVRAARRSRRAVRPQASRGAPAQTERRTRTPRAAKPIEPLTHVYAQIPETVALGVTASIQVDVSREVIEQAARRGADQGAAALDHKRPLIIQIVPRTNIELVTDGRAEIPVPAAGDPTQLFFDVKATHLGPAEVWVVVRQDSLPILTLRLRPEVVTKANAPASARPQHAEASVADGPPVAGDLPKLIITEESVGDQIRYRFELITRTLGVTGVSDFIKGDRDAYVQALYAQIEDDWGPNKDKAEEFQELLRAFGLELLKQLVPASIQAELWKRRRDLSNVLIYSTEPFIPWELVHLKDPKKNVLPRETLFLGQLGVVRWLWGVEMATTLRVRPGRAYTVVPDYPAASGYHLDGTATEATYLSRLLGATPLDPHLEPVRRALSGPEGFDLLHFAGHGGATGGGIQDAVILLEGAMALDSNGQPAFDTNNQPVYDMELLRSTTVNSVAQLQAKDGDRPLVVLNACQAGRMGRQLTSNGGFAQAFVEHGAGAFVSTLWSVLDEPATGFTETFYAHLKKGDTIAKATIAARSTARKAGDATWLAYVVYGNPEAVLVST